MITKTNLKVPFLDLRVSCEERETLLQAIDRVFQHGRFVLGPEISEFEDSMALICMRKYAVGVGSGTMALFLSLKALGIGRDDEVITTSLSWIATANAIALTGATLVFADIGDDLNIDPASVAKLITPKTKAIVPVHYTGKVCDVAALQELARKNNLMIVEDAAQAFGASYHGRPAGSFGDVACFSMNPMKVLGACGEAGVVLTDDERIRDRLHALRYNGTVNKERCIETSLNGRLDTIQAAILLERLKTVDGIINKRREIAGFYTKRLVSLVRTPKELPGEKDIYYTYQIQTRERNALKLFLEERGVEVKIQHPVLMCQQPIYEKCLRDPVLQAERIVQEILCLPIHEKLNDQELHHVVDSVAAFFER